MHSITDRWMDGWTDGRQDDANSRSYCVAVLSAKKTVASCTVVNCQVESEARAVAGWAEVVIHCSWLEAKCVLDSV